MYSIDTNIFIDWWVRRYPPDIFPCVQMRFEQLANSGQFHAPKRVGDEIQHIGPPDLKAWAKQNSSIFLPHDQIIQKEANEILKQFPGFIDPNAIHDEADRYVIALAKVRGFTVVTHETAARLKRNPNRRSHYIPDVCAELHVNCIELLELMRRERWVF
ncbi:MAG: DUF4411 family protein [Nitrospirae bacterium]|nr:DUF4411 family protein [Nitrospirota bacterium]